VFDLEALRDEFPILSRTTYLNSCSLGALSKRGEARLRAFLDEWHTRGASAWYDCWLARLDDLRGRVARFLGAPTHTLALSPSTSVALATIAESLPVQGSRNRVVCSELDFPTLVYQWRVRPDVELVVLPSEDGVHVPLERYAEAVDERTLVLAASHVNFATGHVNDVASLASIAHAVGAFCLIDGYQAPGQIPVDLPATGVDAYTAGPLKWLCGGPGLAYLYVRAERIEALRPRITSWFASADPFAFDPATFRYRDDARRFEMGTPALATVHTALGGQELIDELGIEAIHARNRRLTDRLVEGLTDAGFTLTLPGPANRSAIVMVRHPAPAEAVRRLVERHIVVDHRPGHVRVSPHVYNTEDEIDRFVRALVEVGPTG